MLVLDILNLVEDQKRERSASVLIDLGEQREHRTRRHLLVGLAGIGCGDTLAPDKRMVFSVLEQPLVLSSHKLIADDHEVVVANEDGRSSHALITQFQVLGSLALDSQKVSNEMAASRVTLHHGIPSSNGFPFL